MDNPQSVFTISFAIPLGETAQQNKDKKVTKTNNKGP